MMMNMTTSFPIFRSFLTPIFAVAILGGSLVLTLPSSISAQETVRSAVTPDPTGEEILRIVRMSQALQDLQRLTGKLRNDDDEGKEHQMELTMADSMIRFVFKDPSEIINLDLGANSTRLRRVMKGANVDIPVALYGESVRGTAINYEDLSMRFLYWPNAQVVGEETVSFMKCWIVRVNNPDGRGPYGVVDVWVHKNSGAIAKMTAYDRQAKRVKEFTVRKGQKFKGAWILKQMRVESYDPVSGKNTGRTYMEINDPR